MLSLTICREDTIHALGGGSELEIAGIGSVTCAGPEKTWKRASVMLQARLLPYSLILFLTFSLKPVLSAV